MKVNIIASNILFLNNQERYPDMRDDSQHQSPPKDIKPKPASKKYVHQQCNIESSLKQHLIPHKVSQPVDIALQSICSIENGQEWISSQH